MIVDEAKLLQWGHHPLVMEAGKSTRMRIRHVLYGFNGAITRW